MSQRSGPHTPLPLGIRPSPKPSLGSLRKRSQDPDAFRPRRAGQLPVEVASDRPRSGGRLQIRSAEEPDLAGPKPITHRPENDKEVLTEEGLGLMLSRSVCAADAAHRRPDQRTDCRV